ncbi:MAG: dicarboxylate/amino acid:cation symporter [Acidobacteria bacterium]|nr:dicarboxylate/amino acid:cation symporter [Acidobacteriota bacterium]
MDPTYHFVDELMEMARTMVNVVGNGVAPVLVERELVECGRQELAMAAARDKI